MSKKTSYLILLLFMIIAFGGKSNIHHTTPNNEKDNSKVVADCSKTKLEFTDKGLDLKDFKVAYTKVNVTTMQSKGQKYPAVFITLANYGKGKRYLRRPKEKGQIRLTMSFNGKTGSKITARKYDAGAQGFGQNDHFSANFNSSAKLYYFNKPTGVGEITYFGKDKVCGKISIQNSKGTTILRGTFSVQRK